MDYYSRLLSYRTGGYNLVWRRLCGCGIRAYCLRRQIMIWKRKLRLAKGYVLKFALEVWLAGVLIDFPPPSRLTCVKE